MIAAAFICAAPIATDGDTIRCADGQRVRLAGIEANERGGGCHLPVCPAMPAAAATAVAQRLIHRRRLVCRPVGSSYRRIVASCAFQDGRNLSCAVIAAGAAVRWERYWRAYGLSCPR